ncbi:MAG TPA: adenylosuccinate lyase family protein [Burkholderiales bacterium]
MLEPAIEDAEEDIFSRRHTTEIYLRIERELALAQGAVGVIPAAAAAEIAQRCRIEDVDVEAAWLDAERTGYPIAPLVRQITGLCGKEAGQYVHWGATTMDIMDTALALQLVAALDIVERRLRSVALSLAEIAETHRETIMAGRTFWGHALPITFGYKVATWLAPLLRHLERIPALRSRAGVAELGGAVGTLASMGDRGLAVQREFAQRLDLRSGGLAWHTAHDSIAEVVCLWALIAASLAKAARDLSLLSSTELAEAFEPPSGGKDTSSTLPQKTNPIYSAQIIACAGVLAQHAALAMQAMHQSHERSGEGMIEFPLVADAYRKTLRALDKMQTIADGISIDVRRMRDNLELTQGQIMSEALMMALGETLGRLEAHDVVHEACRRAAAEGIPLERAALRDQRIASALGEEGVRRMLDPKSYLGSAHELTDRVVQEARRSACAGASSRSA